MSEKRNEFLKKIGVLSFLGLALVAHELSTEQLTMTTYYPAPYGVYNTIITTGQTTLARDSGTLVIGNGTPASPRANLLQIQDGNQAAGKVLTALDANGTASWQTSPGGGFQNMRVYDTPGSYTWPPGGVTATKVMVEVWGGGGGGYSGDKQSSSGGGGGYGKGIFDLTSPPYTITVGAGGAGGVFPCGVGGASSFGALITATGGGACGNPGPFAGLAGGASGAVLNVSGGNGTICYHCGYDGYPPPSDFNYNASDGGNGGNGGVGGRWIGGAGGLNGTAPGGGGGGLGSDSSAVPAILGSTGNGAPGRVVVYW
ncbi:MAG: hypothetical protein HY399_03190 [Elusimicrobia bacterium]|nr:hypothetical protein [Elusimicrobiota bacterium]